MRARSTRRDAASTAHRSRDELSPSRAATWLLVFSPAWLSPSPSSYIEGLRGEELELRRDRGERRERHRGLDQLAARMKHAAREMVHALADVAGCRERTDGQRTDAFAGKIAHAQTDLARGVPRLPKPQRRIV